MAISDRARGVKVLASLSASYVFGRPIATLIGAPPLARIAMFPACMAWSAALAATGAIDAIQIGARVRRAPILRSRPALLARASELAPVCTLISDTHVVAPGRIPTELAVDPVQWPFRAAAGSDELVSGLRRVLEHVRREAPSTVIWCGDEVDTGDPREWERWREVVEAVPGLAHRLVPGNHDICFNRPFDEDYALGRRAVRERAYQQHGGPLGDFPILDSIVTDAGPAHVVLLDSCRNRSKHVLSNAIGNFGEIQLDELARMLRCLHGPLLCVAHHHVWRDDRFLEPEAWYNTAVDADRLVAILGSYRRADARNHVLVCHGHRHVLTAGTVGERESEIAIVGLPSTTLGDKSIAGRLDGVLRYGVAGLRRDGSWGVQLHEVGTLVSSAENVSET